MSRLPSSARRRNSSSALRPNKKRMGGGGRFLAHSPKRRQLSLFLAAVLFAPYVFTFDDLIIVRQALAATLPGPTALGEPQAPSGLLVLVSPFELLGQGQPVRAPFVAFVLVTVSITTPRVRPVSAAATLADDNRAPPV